MQDVSLIGARVWTYWLGMHVSQLAGAIWTKPFRSGQLLMSLGLDNLHYVCSSFCILNHASPSKLVYLILPASFRSSTQVLDSTISHTFHTGLVGNICCSGGSNAFQPFSSHCDSCNWCIALELGGRLWPPTKSESLVLWQTGPAYQLLWAPWCPQSPLILLLLHNPYNWQPTIIDVNHYSVF